MAPTHDMSQRRPTLLYMSNVYTVLGILCAALLFGLAACEREGPAEKAGRSVDRAAKDIGDAVKDAVKK
jgi:hypothetical protein